MSGSRKVATVSPMLVRKFSYSFVYNIGLSMLIYSQQDAVIFVTPFLWNFQLQSNDRINHLAWFLWRYDQHH